MSMVDRWLATTGPDAPRATDEELDAAQTDLGVVFPSDYREMMRRANGGEAEFGSSWIRVWPVGHLAEANAEYQVKAIAPGFIFFGTDGGGEAYAWDFRPNRRSQYVVIPFIVPEPEAAVGCGDSIEEFLATLHRGIPFEPGLDPEDKTRPSIHRTPRQGRAHQLSLGLAGLFVGAMVWPLMTWAQQFDKRSPIPPAVVLAAWLLTSLVLLIGREYRALGIGLSVGGIVTVGGLLLAARCLITC
jgi:hypothetical protein